VIVPTYNRARVVGEAIESALGQTRPPLEVIVVDDGSTDDTGAVVGRYVARHGADRVKYVRQANAGPATARNTGVAHSSGEVIALLDSDDRWSPEKLALQLPLLGAAPVGGGDALPFGSRLNADVARDVGMVYGGFRCFGEAAANVERAYYAGDDLGFHDLLAFVALGTQTLIFRRDVFDAVGGFDEACSPAEDQDFTIRVAARYAIRGLDRTVAEIRLHGEQISGDKSRMFRASMHVLRKNLGAHGPCAACGRAARAARRKIHGFYYRDLNQRARAAAVNWRVVRAAGLCLKAFWVDPGALARASGRLLCKAQRG
jgi:glycosyltransferase involved in cell wall biosynthesis